ncbi:hypothetical protein ppKF707_3156 [Metapseudomonas furukawaii]|uniref:Uncharacterized protein n=1 Tax=Metapseudomonas furukawaii TaxID=1149133 RepID=A0AAD1C2J6_METFU|nr:hypothetical protein ppKF707_3156 [Pseudomonas furukawaii]BAU74917.1 hypothetical protein KF707C_32290 [Pseudomonas furukawaii]
MPGQDEPSIQLHCFNPEPVSLADSTRHGVSARLGQGGFNIVQSA